MAVECCSSCEYQRTVGYPSTSWASCTDSRHDTKRRAVSLRQLLVSILSVVRSKLLTTDDNKQTLQINKKCQKRVLEMKSRIKRGIIGVTYQ